ncbi:hypothetical protein BJ322DRAFT_1194914 [Thelephora terrestris]|uniref:Uncharacterized protein n=1 Tax=Thelephora terrestris TaxID=56493 RepID=A0A9P6HCH5_9AGAM|nr:hypothetical protein BJ322DRAFT_1194914 [Thelephora terrestris]
MDHTGDSSHQTHTYVDDDIRVEYHPNSGRQTEVFKLDEYRQPTTAASTTADPEPWAPFRTREDFEFAEIALETGMTRGQVDALIKLFHRCINKGQGSFTISNHKDMADTFKIAANRLTKFEKRTITPKYKDDECQFDVLVRPIMGWAEEMLQDEDLIHHFVWDAQHVSKFDSSSESWVRVFDEPWTADRFWEIQTNLPKDAKPLTFCFFADKTKLSSFGTQKGYPVIARCTNLPVNLRNGTGIGGGRIVGWLPIMEEKAQESGKRDYVNFKRVIWHDSFYELMDSIHAVSKTGLYISCADGIVRHLYPVILILSADYEEQCFMALIRGSSGNYPCPVCLAPKTQLCDGSTHPLRTSESMEKVYDEAVAMNTIKDREEHLKEYGLRNVENIFWSLENSDPHRALSFDRLHANHLGLFKDHLWGEAKRLVEANGRQALGQVDNQIMGFPRWRGLRHFADGAMAITFSDGSTFEDLSKISMFVLHNIFEEGTSGYLLLKALRCYIEVDIYASLEVHTEATIASGREKLTQFYGFIEEYMGDENNALDTKNWDFPKIHSLQHLFDDIVAKGATRNYNTKTNESLNQPLKGIYLNRTNFRDVAEQILNLIHLEYLVCFIRTKLNKFDQMKKEQEAEGLDVRDQTGALSTSTTAPEGISHIYLGAPKKDETPLSELTNPAGFSVPNLLNLLETFVNQSRTQEEGYYRVRKEHMVKEFHYLRVAYKSMVNWQDNTDYLRCNESFFGHPRFDHVIVAAEGGPFFAQLLCLFKIQAGTHSHSLALTRTYGLPPGSTRRKDRELGLYRVRVKSRPYKIIAIESIVRGAVLVEDGDNPGDYFVVDTIDSDMFLRMTALSL